MSFALFINVLASCDVPIWGANNKTIDLAVKKMPVDFKNLRELAKVEIFVESLTDPNNLKAQNEFNNGKDAQLSVGASIKLGLPRTVNKFVVARNLADLLTLDSITYKEPASYCLVEVDNSADPFVYTETKSLSTATPLILSYHNAIGLWKALAGWAEYVDSTSHHLFFFGIRKTELIPRFCIKDLTEDIALSEIVGFTTNEDRTETRKEIFCSVLSEFLQDQNADRAFSYLLRQSTLFARRLKEGMAIYLSDHSPEKLAQEAQAKYLELVEKLEKIVNGMEAKSLTIPAAVLLAVKEAEFGGKWTTLNFIILISTGLYLLTMLVVFLSQRVILNLLKTTIQKTTIELKEQGLDAKNPILDDSFVKLEARRNHTQIWSWVMLFLSCIPLLAVIYAVFCACPSEPSSYTIKLTPTNSVQIIQSTNPQIVPLIVNTNGQPAKN